MALDAGTVDDLQRRFANMSANRDRDEASTTEGKGYSTEKGYVQEFVSSSPLYHGDTTTRQVITKRVVVTEADSSATTTLAPQLQTGSIGVTQFRADRQPTPGAGNDGRRGTPTAVRPLPMEASLSPLPNYGKPANSSSYNAGLTQSYSSAVQSPFYATSAPQQAPRPLTPTAAIPDRVAMEWRPAGIVRREEVYHPQPRSTSTERYAHMYRGEPKNVAFGHTDTRVIEPSRVSPMQVHDVYAPVKYLTRREARRLRRERARNMNDLESKIRSSSVPRLDAMREHRGRSFAPYGENPEEIAAAAAAAARRRQSPVRGRETPPVRQEIDRDEYMFRAQPPLVANRSPLPFRSPSLRGDSNRGTPSGRFYSTPPSQRQYEPQRVSAGGVVPEYGDYPVPAIDQLPPLRRQFPSAPRMANSPRPASSYSSPQPVAKTYLPPSAATIEEFAMVLARARGVPVPSPPQYAANALRLLNRGTYLIKYPKQGNPHERYLALRFVADEEFSVSRPYLVWALHADSATFHEKLHLSLLVDFQRGVQSPGFQRQLLAPQVLRGPFAGSKRAQLPATFAFSLIFQSLSTTRTVDLLALDDQTFRCWELVCTYLASINTHAEARAPQDADTMAPDTPRSLSSHAPSM